MKILYTLPIIGSVMFLSGCASNYKTQPAEPAPVAQSHPVQMTATPAPAPFGITPPTGAPVYNYEQKLYAPGAGATLLEPQQHAGEIINAFEPAYAKLGKPRFVIYVNRELLGKTQRPAKTAPAPSGKDTGALADKQTARDIERIAGKPFRYAGATLADQQIATTLATADIRSPEAREALKKVADIAVEILVSSRDIAMPGNVAGDGGTLTIPDIQMTAIRLSDAAILGQATSADVTNPLPYAALGNLAVQDVLEATALNLMSDITATAK